MTSPKHPQEFRDQYARTRETELVRLVLTPYDPREGISLANASKTAAPVNWRSLSYSYKDNDRLVLHGDIWPGDLVYLLREMDRARRRAST
jgi:hypothetical protein